MHLAIINKQTHVVENIAVPPQGAQAYFVPEQYYGVLTNIGAIGDTYDTASETFIKPVTEEI